MPDLITHPSIKSSWQSHDGSVTLYNADCLEALKTLPDCSIDSIVTDPPYELGFMGKSWDSTGIAYNVDLWKECIRVLKPGGHLLSFGGSRTYHRMTCAIEDAGFEIRDQIMWVYGSGFPKSLDVSKAIDKAAGEDRETVGSVKITGRVADNPLWGANNRENGGGMGFRSGNIPVTVPATEQAKQWSGWGTALKPAHEPICVARKPFKGTVADNVLTYGMGAINIDGCRVGTEAVNHKQSPHGRLGGIWNSEGRSEQSNPTGRFPANLIHDGSEEVVRLFPAADGATSNSSNGHFGVHEYGHGQYISLPSYSDSGSAARFFYCAKASKTDRNEGCEGMEKKRGTGALNMRSDEHAQRNGMDTSQRNHHPTVKPTDLMRYLCRLVTPKDGTVLDPFTGSGSTGKACMREGFNFIGIELSPGYFEIAVKRIDAECRQMRLF